MKIKLRRFRVYPPARLIFIDSYDSPFEKLSCVLSRKCFHPGYFGSFCEPPSNSHFGGIFACIDARHRCPGKAGVDDFLENLRSIN